MKRSQFVASTVIGLAFSDAVTREVSIAGADVPKQIAGISIPDSGLAREATATAQAAENEALFGHSLRSFVFAELIAKAQNVRHDPELVYVAALLHDIGLTNAFATPHRRFEVDGAEQAKNLLTKRSAPDNRIRIVWDAIALHTMYGIARYKDPEVRLVSAGVITDVGAAFAPVLKKDDMRALFREVPRSGFNRAFLAQLADYAKRKPDTIGDTFIEDVALRTDPAYHASNFYDAMLAGDAFASLE
jgi:HD domain